MPNKSEGLISQIRELEIGGYRLSPEIEDSLINDVRILVSEKEGSKEIFAATGLKEKLKKGELFKLLKLLEGHGKIKEWVMEDRTQIYFTYFGKNRNYHLVLDDEGNAVIGRYSDDGIVDKSEFGPVINYVSSRIREAAKRDDILTDNWSLGVREYDYSYIVVSRIESIKKYTKDGSEEE